MPPPERTIRPLTVLGEGLSAGLCLTLADALASGLQRTPWRMQVLGLGLGLAAGLAAGLAGLLLRRRGLGLGLVLSFAAGLNGLSLVSKQLEPASQQQAGLAVALLSVLAGAACLGQHTKLFTRFLLLASVPASALLTSLTGASPLVLIFASGLPLFLALIMRSGGLQPRRTGRVLLSGSVCVFLLALPVALKDPSLQRPDLKPGPVRASSDAPDLLLVILDTLRADALGSDGPLARIGQQGLRFEQCISTAPWTLPSVSSILTGLLPSQHGATQATRSLPQDVETLAERLRQGGYQTAAFTGGAFVSPTFQLDQGFEHFDPAAEFGFQPYRLYVPLAWRLAKNRYWPMHAAIDWVDEFHGFAGVCEAAQEWLSQRDRSRPFFVVLHTYEIHDYYLQHGRTDAQVIHSGLKLSDRFHGRLSVHPEELIGATQADLDYFEAIYKNRQLHVEQTLERFMGELSALPGKAPVLAVTSDHGEGFDAQRGRVHHGGRLHEDQLRVPLLLLGPGRVPEGVVIGEPVSTLDLAPTFLALAGLKSAEELPGRSLLESSRGQLNPARSLWSEERANGRSLLVLRREGWKLLREEDQEQYFDLGQDPMEERALDHAPEHLRTSLGQFPLLFPARDGESSAIDAQTEAHLRSIGYLGDQEED